MRSSRDWWMAVPVLVRGATLLGILLFPVISGCAGGPKYVAGSTYFNSSTMGQPLIWNGGQINYYTDQGDLSPVLPNSAANALVANAFLQWTSISSAAISANNSGPLTEDVNASNLAVDSNGTITAPADITSSATQKPVAIVYDFDGSITSALLGQGAGSASQCFWNAAFGGADNFGTGANMQHALVVLNGQCALLSSQLTDVEYRLVRVLGQVLGLGWSQLNLNVITGNPVATGDDFSGFPVMHYLDPVTCIPITVCYSNPYQPAPDDIAALSRLYPPHSPPPNTARIQGSVYFSNHAGGQGQPMQGVNVFARWIDPSTNLPSHHFSASSVSGFSFTGNFGNPITGFTDALGNAYSEFGSNDQSAEGFFDLAGLPIPNGAATAQYQLSVEALDPAWSAGVNPYESSQVAPSGAFQPVTVTVAAGGDFQQDIQMSGSGQSVPSWAATETWGAPAAVLPSGDWVGSLSGYGDVAYFSLPAQANRTFSIAVTALDEKGIPSESKAQPVVGVWTVGDAQGTPPPAFTSSPFNSSTFGTSRLDSQILASNSFIVGIADLRGDGRPDYHYHARVLYADSVTPSRLPVTGGGFVLRGTGFSPGLVASIGIAAVPVIATNAGEMLLSAPPQGDSAQTITVTDAGTGAFSTMTAALTFGATASDKLLLLQGANPATPVGTQATNPMVVQAVASDGVTPVWGATVGWSATNGATMSVCGGASSCSATTDQSGLASTWLTPALNGVATITATLAPGVYSPPQSAAGTLLATSSSTDIGMSSPYLWVAQGASTNIPITARVLSNGSAKTGVTVNFSIAQGVGSLNSATAITDNSGYATVTLSLNNFTSNFQVVACVAPGDLPCQTVYGNAVSSLLLRLQPVSGGAQIISGQAFQPITVRVTDNSSPSNPVLGAAVLFQSTVMRPSGGGLVSPAGDSIGVPTGVPFILGTAQNSIISDSNGLASFLPNVSSLTGSLQVEVQVSAGTSALLEDVLQSFPQNQANVPTWVLQLPNDRAWTDGDGDEAANGACGEAGKIRVRDCKEIP